MKWNDIIIVYSLAVLLRVMVGLWGHSGQGIPPMFGDFEAQRHWLEITYHLPIGDWYRQTKYNDLLYWGLDYPPLTAYVSLAYAYLASFFCPELIAWESSRGYEDPEGKFFMRMSVLILDCVILIPSLIWSLYLIIPSSDFCKDKPKTPSQFTSNSNLLAQIVLVTIPSLLLIDHGHFQYNGTCLGLALLGANCILTRRDILGSIFFCLSLNFKQMSLYYSPVFFFVLLRKCFVQPTWFKRIFKFLSIGLTVIGTFGLLWFPFCLYHDLYEETCTSSLLHVLQRQFPFSRGIFEDKVSNLWYALSVVYDYREVLPSGQMVYLSLGLTLSLLAPVGYQLLTTKINPALMYSSLTASSLSFFLASFQVHEKSILLPLIPASLLLFAQLPTNSKLVSDRDFAIWFQILGTFTMFPLLKKDKLVIPYFCVLGLFLASMIGHQVIATSSSSNGQETSSSSSTSGHIISPKDHAQLIKDLQAKKSQHPSDPSLNDMKCPFAFSNTSQSSNIYTLIVQGFLDAFLQLSYLGMFTLHVLEVIINPPPARYPDLFPALFSLFGAANLLVAYSLLIYRLYVPNTNIIEIIEQLKKNI